MTLSEFKQHTTEIDRGREMAVFKIQHSSCSFITFYGSHWVLRVRARVCVCVWTDVDADIDAKSV